MFGAREAAWPLIRADLNLSYAQIGLLLAIPEFISAALEPGVGLIGDTSHRRTVIVLGGIAYAGALIMTAMAGSFAVALVAFCLMYPAAGALVSLTQANLVDARAASDGHEVTIARWTVAGAVGVMAGPLLLSGFVSAGSSWRTVMAILAIAAVGLAAASLAGPSGHGAQRELSDVFAGALRHIQRKEVLRWIAVLEVADLMQDIFTSFLALYLVDAAGLTPVTAGAALALWTGVGLAGDVALLWLLQRVDPLKYLRLSAGAVALLFPAFLVAGSPGVKLGLLVAIGVARAGWYAIPQGRLFAELEDSTGTAVAVSQVAGAIARTFPLLIGAVAGLVGIGGALWLLLVGPIGVFIMARGQRVRMTRAARG